MGPHHIGTRTQTHWGASQHVPGVQCARPGWADVAEKPQYKLPIWLPTAPRAQQEQQAFWGEYMTGIKRIKQGLVTVFTVPSALIGDVTGVELGLEG